MSQPKRYAQHITLKETVCGDYVLYQDYAAIAAENERLREIAICGYHNSQLILNDDDEDLIYKRGKYKEGGCK